MNKLLGGALIAAAGILAACSGNSNREEIARNPAPCPNIIVLNDAARLIEFTGEERLEDIAYSAEITDADIGCRYHTDIPIDVDLALNFAFGKGPKGENGEKLFTYFVAVTRQDSEVIAKKEFTIPVKFNDKNTIVRKQEKIGKITIPRADGNVSGINFEIVVGLSLTVDQVQFNRSGKSLKFPNLQ